MVTGQRIILGCIVSAWLMSITACSNIKHLPAGESLYTGAKVKVEGPELSSKQRKVLVEDLTGLSRPRPNRKFLGGRLRLFAYNFAGNPKKETSLMGRLKYRFGEPPVVLSDVNLEKNSEILNNSLDNRGFFNSSVTADTVVKRRKATVVYTVKIGYQYKIDSIAFEMDSSFIGNSIRETQVRTLLRPGNPFNLEMIKAERNRIDAHLKENGFYYFSPEYILVEADSTVGNHKVNMFVRLKPGVPHEARQLYTIKDVFVYTNFRLNAAAADTNKKGAVLYKGYYVIDRQKRYKPKLFEQALQFEQGDVYNRTEHNISLQRLVNLGVFKFVKNRFEPANSPFAQLNAFYYLTPHPKKSLRLEVTGTSKSNNLLGTNVTLAWRNRNTFKAGELFTIAASGGAEVQYSSAFQNSNVYRGGIEMGLTFPRYLLPNFLMRKLSINSRGGFVPKTNILVAYDLLNKQKQYTLNSFRTSFGYSWKENIFKEHQLNPISINYVQPIRVSPQYQDSADNNPTYAKVIEKQFILGANYNYIFNGLAEGKNINAMYFSGTADLGGNLLGLATGAKGSPDNPSQLFGKSFSQFVKLEADFRIYRRIGDNTTWANRIIGGFGYPYGNSRELPFVKQFFIGGNNSIRAFRTRSLGPGSFNGITQSTFVPDQSGDIKLELNTELRQKLFSIVHGAIFVDAGNIWLYRNNPNKPGAEFTKDFLKELAVGTGLGLRFDVSILILRLDLAFPLRIPYLPEGDRWVIKKIAFGDRQWRKDNLIFNLAIGYPF